MNAYYRTWDRLTEAQKATPAAEQAQKLYADGNAAGATALLTSLIPAVDLTETIARMGRTMTPLDQMPGARYAEANAYSPSKVARRSR